MTPQDIIEQEFVKAVFGGYDISSVDEFFQKMSEDYDAMYKENTTLKNKIKVLVEKVEEYRTTEESMRMALLTAQKMGNEIVDKANKKSESIMNEAHERVKGYQKEIEDKIRAKEKQLKDLEIMTSQFSRKILDLYKNQVEFIKSLSGLVVPTDLDKSISKIPKEADVKGNKIQKSDDLTLNAYDKAVNNVVNQPKDKEAGVKDTKSNVAQTPKVLEAKKKDEKDDIARSISESLGDTKKLDIDPNAKLDDNDEPTTKRPSFNFDDLKFGSNFGNESK